MQPRFVVGLDLAQSHDWTALIGLECHEPLADLPPDVSEDDPRRATRYDVVLIERWRGRSYTIVPALVQRAEAVLRHFAVSRLPAESEEPVESRHAATLELVVDATGVGAAVVDLLDDAGLDPIPIVITGGIAVGRGDRGQWTVPKTDLVAAIQVLIEGHRIKAADLPHAPTLTQELANFRYDYSPSGHLRFGAGGDELVWRGEGAHDDLVLATAVAAWWAERNRPSAIVAPWGATGGTFFTRDSDVFGGFGAAHMDPWR